MALLGAVTGAKVRIINDFLAEPTAKRGVTECLTEDIILEGAPLCPCGEAMPTLRAQLKSLCVMRVKWPAVRQLSLTVDVASMLWHA